MYVQNTDRKTTIKINKQQQLNYIHVTCIQNDPGGEVNMFAGAKLSPSLLDCFAECIDNII